MADPTNQKDFWDKLEIIGKVALPVVIAGATLWFNSQLSSRQTSADMVQIAVGVLSQNVDDTEFELGVDPLREWAVEVLDNPTEIQELTEDAKSALVLGTSTLAIVEVGTMVLEGMFQPEPFPLMGGEGLSFGTPIDEVIESVPSPEPE